MWIAWKSCKARIMPARSPSCGCFIQKQSHPRRQADNSILTIDRPRNSGSDTIVRQVVAFSVHTDQLIHPEPACRRSYYSLCGHGSRQKSICHFRDGRPLRAQLVCPFAPDLQYYIREVCMPQILSPVLLLGVLLVLASCGDSSYQVRQPLGYGMMPPGETWVTVDSAYQSPAHNLVYFDPTTIRRDGALVTLWQLTDYKWMQGNAPFGRFMMGPHRFFSTKSHKEFDCVDKHVRLLASSEHSQHMGTGVRHAVAVAQDSRLPIEPSSINEALWKVACGKTEEGIIILHGRSLWAYPAHDMCLLATDLSRFLWQSSPILSFFISRSPSNPPRCGSNTKLQTKRALASSLLNV